MTSAIDGLEPQLLWKHFAALSRIPRGSKNEAAAARYVLDTAAAARPPGAPGRGGERPRREAGDRRAGTRGERLPPVAPRHGLREERGQGARLHEGPDRAGARGQRAARQRHHPRGGQRRRGGGGARGGGGSLAGARAARAALHDRRGDRPHRGAAPGARLSPEPHPPQPGLGAGGRDLRGLRRGPGHPGHLEGRARGREGEHGRAGAPRDGPAGRPLRPGDRQGPRERGEDPQSHPARAGGGGRRPPGVDRGREQAQRHPARGLSRSSASRGRARRGRTRSSGGGSRWCARSWGRSSRTSG